MHIHFMSTVLAERGSVYSTASAYLTLSVSLFFALVLVGGASVTAASKTRNVHRHKDRQVTGTREERVKKLR